ncbi:hypothetical protein J2752_002003 [Halarchaeum rubridurum]|uniref:Pyrrolo-quinoline quinone repeat domain-containing protein n=1 Tax=Halarchaeum rubridurum TaxID=489911 RepID=A0A830G0C2_9EURY|nr:PQQ-binding-like beta-propeller repeat protein [Halarchaeum rubridurum]MBP1955091.1 hypothetical protein [Halarchaeum rubridurum]GGM69011.1 hypothetical protein GCM10009017_19040 [Halarchaeum rubridurum]
MSDTPVCGRRQVLRTTSAFTALGIVGYTTSTTAAADPGDLQWAFTYGGGGSSPTVVNGTAFVGSMDRNLYAVNAETGEAEWAFYTGGRVHSSPTVVDGIVFIVSSDSNLYAVNAETGEEEWAFKDEYLWWSSPTVVGGMVFVGSGDSNLYAVNAETGEEEWTFATGGQVRSSPTVVDGTVFVGSRDSNLYAVNAETGEEEWAFEPQAYGLGRSSPTVVDGTIFVSGYRSLYAVDAGVTGSSEGSRTTLGTLGHHADWRYAEQSVIIPTTTRPRQNSSTPTTATTEISRGSDETTLFTLLKENQLPISLFLVAGGVLGVGEFIRQYWSARSSGPTQPSDTSTTDPELRQIPDPEPEDYPAEPSQLQELAIETIDRAETAKASGDYVRAENAYAEAITQLKRAIEAAKSVDGDNIEDPKARLETTKMALNTVTTQREQRSSLAEDLQSSEQNFQDAIVQYLIGNETVSRIRFRQARNGFKRAEQTIERSTVPLLETPVTVTFEREVALPSTNLDGLTIVSDTTVEALSSADIKTLSDLTADYGEIIPEVVRRIGQKYEISESEKIVLILLSWWYDSDSHDFTDMIEISQRYKRADYGFNKSI